MSMDLKQEKISPDARSIYFISLHGGIGPKNMFVHSAKAVFISESN